MKVSHYADLTVWQASMNWVEGIYTLTKEFPRDEIYGLTSQLRRAAVSVPANIGEGSARSSTKELLHFLAIARGSLAEAETLLLLARRLQMGPEGKYGSLLEESDKVGRMLSGLKKSLTHRDQGA